uniref:G-protein coupled receptors family 1 profile domain-containing protein n=1 Tax=Romanomermis culicivorax TaxID=13658 RepID=A0A915ICD1_ROMCU
MINVTAELSSWTEQTLVTLAIVIPAIVALVVNLTLLLAVFSNRQMFDHFVLIYSAYIVNNILCSLSYIYRRLLRLAFLSNVYLLYMEKWKCHLLFEILVFAETNYCCFIFTISIIRFLATYCPEKFLTFTKKHALSILLYTWSLYTIRRKRNQLARLNRAINSIRQQNDGVDNIEILIRVILTFRVLTFLLEGVGMYFFMKSQPIPTCVTWERVMSFLMLILALDKILEPIFLLINMLLLKEISSSLTIEPTLC